MLRFPLLPLKHFASLLAFCSACIPANGAVQVIGVQYQPDKYFNEDNCLWHDRQYPGPCSINLNTGQVVKVFLKNIGPSSATISDATLAGFSLNQNLKAKNAGGENIPYSIYYGSANVTALVNAGEPVWYKADPAAIPVGGVGQVVVRLRVIPVTQPIAIGVISSSGTASTNISVDANAPLLASVGFSSDRTKVYLHWRRTGGAAPTAVWMDGVDVTANATTVGDPTLNFGATVLEFDAPLENMSFHVYQGVFADAKKATGALRTWVNPFLYGTWAAKPTNPGEAAGKTWVNEATAHGVNCVVMNVASDGLSDLMSTASGRQWMDDRGYGVVKDDPSSASQILRMWFIRDEPDGADANMTGLPAGGGHNPGVLAMSALQRGEVLRAAKSDVPVTVNIDGNVKPYNYWNWGQVPDVFMTDPYYQPELSDAYWNHPEQIPLYARATQVYAVARTAGLACEPNPLHVILYSNKQKDGSGNTWPFPAPGTKRTEVYYALAGGAKGMAYWWYKLPDGLAYNNADAQALWKEMGLLGNEIKTAQPMLVSSHPVSLPTTATSGLWVRTLAVGNDAMIFLIVNDNHYNDSTGCHYTQIANATVNATLPSWLASATAFEIKPSGLSDVNSAINGTAMQFNLGTVQLTRMIVVTTDPQLRSTIQARYVQQVWPGICQFAPEYCTPQTSPPVITVQPSSHTVAPGGSTTFGVVASGSDPLSYRWQKNGTNLNNGGHYYATTTATLTISNADTNDVASYRCVVTNAYGMDISSPATLTVAVGCPPAILVNAGFEAGNSGGVASGWTGYQRAPNPTTTTWTIQTASPPVGGGLQYQQIANSSSTGGGGVRQDVTGCIVGATYTIAGWTRGNSANSICTIKCSPTTSTSWATAVDLSPPQTVSGSTWTPFSGTVVATGNTMTLWLDGQTSGSGNFNAACFDSITVSCAGAAVPPSITGQPSDKFVAPGGATSFTLVASGSDPLSYQWRKNSLNLANDGHFSGTDTDTLEINGADATDATSYRCVVSNAYGSITSSPALLTLIGNCALVGLDNGDFEGANINGVALGWIGYQRAPTPTTVWSIQTAAPLVAGSLQYQQIANTTSTGGGGVRQDVSGCAVGGTYVVSGWMRGNSGLYSTCTVKVSPTASTNWATAMHLNPPQIYTGDTWVTFSGTVVATGPAMTIWLDGQTGGSGVNKAECFDSVTVTCLSIPTPLRIESVNFPEPSRVGLVLSGPVGSNITILRSSNLVNWITLTNLANPTGTLPFTDTTVTNLPRQFYRATSP